MVNTAILMKVNGDLSIMENIDFNEIMKDKEMGCPISKQGYKISIAVKLFEYMSDDEFILNRRATETFTNGDLYGDVYIFLDPEETDEETHKEYKKLYEDLKNNTYIRYTNKDREETSKKLMKMLSSIKKETRKRKI